MRLSNPTGRKTECRRLQIGGAVLFFSYETLIGCTAWDGSLCRRANEWGPTTGRHFSECGLRDALVCDEETLLEVADTALRFAVDASRAGAALALRRSRAVGVKS